MANGTGYWFSHDYNARSDSKIKKLIAKLGMEGYGAFWAIVEDLYNNANALHLDCDCIAYDLHVDCETIKSIIHDFELFVISEEKVSSNSVQRRIDERNNKSIKASTAAKKRWADANALQTQSEGNAIKGNNIKGNKRKRKESIVFTPPTLDEVIEYFTSKGYTVQSAKKAFEHYNVADWKDTNGNQVNNWKQKMNTVWFKDENLIPTSKSKAVW